MDALTPYTINYEVLGSLGPNDIIKPLLGTTMTPTVLEDDFSDIDDASIVLGDLLVDIQSMNDTFQCPPSDSFIIPPPSNIFKGPRNLGELSLSTTPTTSCQRPSTPSLNPTSLQSSSTLALPSNPVSSSPLTNKRFKTSHPFRG